MLVGFDTCIADKPDLFVHLALSCRARAPRWADAPRWGARQVVGFASCNAQWGLGDWQPRGCSPLHADYSFSHADAQTNISSKKSCEGEFPATRGCIVSHAGADLRRQPQSAGGAEQLVAAATALSRAELLAKPHTYLLAMLVVTGVRCPLTKPVVTAVELQATTDPHCSRGVQPGGIYVYVVQRESTPGGPGSGLRPGRNRFLCQLPLWFYKPLPTMGPPRCE
jgi:hypothetical protein